MRSGSDFLLQSLRDRHDLAALSLDFEKPKPFPRADVYVLASAFQKAIRRGDITIARRAGHQLLALDPQRLWRRLMVVALEDIGIADIGVASDLVGIAALASARRLIGDNGRALDAALVRACGAPKDRSGDHLSSIVVSEPIDPADAAVLKAASPAALIAILASSDLPWLRRLRAALLASGRADEPCQSIAPDIRGVFDVLYEQGVPLPLIVTCEAYAARQRDILPILIPFAWLLRARSNVTAQITSHNLPPSALIDELPDWSFDPLWTRIGKRAVELFVHSHAMKPPFTGRMVAAALWNAESALCDRTLCWAVGDELRERAYRADLLARGVPVQSHAELNAWIERERPALLAARKTAWTHAQRPESQNSTLEQVYLPLPVPEPRKRDV